MTTESNAFPTTPAGAQLEPRAGAAPAWHRVVLGSAVAGAASLALGALGAVVGPLAGARAVLFGPSTLLFAGGVVLLLATVATVVLMRRAARGRGADGSLSPALLAATSIATWSILVAGALLAAFGLLLFTTTGSARAVVIVLPCALLLLGAGLVLLLGLVRSLRRERGERR